MVEVLSPDLEAAIDFEISSAPEQIDAFRQQLLQQFMFTAADMELDQRTWASCAPLDLQQLVVRIHGPLWNLLCHCLPVASLLLCNKVFHWPDGCHHVKDVQLHAQPVDSLHTSRREFNERILNSLAPQWRHQRTHCGRPSSCMSPPHLLVPSGLSTKSLTRRIWHMGAGRAQFWLADSCGGP